MVRSWILAFLGVVAAAGGAGADPFAEFRIPSHSTRQGSVDIHGTGSWLDGGGQTSQQDHSALRGDLTTRVAFGWDSDALLYEFGLGATVAASRDRWNTRNELPTGTSTSAFRIRNLNEIWSLGGSLRAYPWQRPIGLEAQLFGRGGYTQRSVDREALDISITPPTRFESSTREESRFRVHDVQLSAAVGFGRVRDASVVHEVFVLENRLRDTGVIVGPLSGQVRGKVAQLLFIRTRYSAAHERPDRYFWRDLERILGEAGVLADEGMDSYSLLRLTEPTGPFGVLTRQSNFMRKRGWFAGPVVWADHRRHVESTETRVTERQYLGESLVTGSPDPTAGSNVSSLDRASLGGRAEFHLPVGWYWQIDLESQWTTPVRPDEHGLDEESSASVTWFVAERWNATFTFNHARRIFEPRRSNELADDSWTVNSTLGLAYYIEDRTELFARLNLSQQDSEGFGARNYRRETELRIGMAYRFLGALDAAGLVDPLRLRL